jgi:inhibitor of KinA
MEGLEERIHDMNNNELLVGMSPLGEAAIRLELGDRIQPEIHRRVKRVHDHLERHPFPGMIECVPAFATVTVFYDPFQVKMLHQGQPEFDNRSPYEIVSLLLEQLLSGMGKSAHGESRVVEIPVCYGGDFGPDLADVAEHHRFRPEEVIDIHTGGEYLVYMIGFAPGFPYLGGLPERIATPRRSSPRTSIPAGSVGIAGMQTGVYPISTPGGWQLIGRTPLRLFRPDAHPPSLLQSGDMVKFRAISPGEFARYEEENA